MLAGGNYLTTLFDDNAPPVFMFFLPVAVLSKFTNFTNANFYILYILTIFAIANFLTIQVLNCKIIENYSKLTLYVSGLIGTLFLAIGIFGVRENIIISLLIPYLYLNLFEGKNPSKLAQFFVALLAAIAIMQVPYYLIVTLSIDLIERLYNKVKLQYYQILFYSMCGIIFIISLLLYPDYYFVLLKILYDFQVSINQPLFYLVNNLTFYTVVGGLIISSFFTLVFYRKLYLVKIILITSIMLIIYLLENKYWFYHIYPAIFGIILSFAILHAENKSCNANDLLSQILKTPLMAIFAILILIDLLLSGSIYHSNYLVFNNPNSPTNKLIAFARTAETNNNILFFNTRVQPTYLLPIYSGVDIVSPWANNWMLPALVTFEYNQTQIKYYSLGKKLFFNLSLNTIKQQKPEYIIYPEKGCIPYINQKNFDILTYLKQNVALKAQLDSYINYKIIKPFIILKYKG